MRRIRTPTAVVLFCTLLAIGCADEEPQSPTAGAVEQGRFVERGEEAGIRFKMAFLPGEQGLNFKVNLYDHGSGVAVGDIDGDGFDDLYFLNQLGANALYRNRGDGTFEDVTGDAGPLALADRICTSAAFNDVDNDGDQDLYVTSTRGGNALFVNDGNGHFRDATQESGTGWLGHSQGATFFDADNDGDLDLLVTNTARWTTDRFQTRDRYYEGLPTLWTLIKAPIEHNVFFRNDGTGHFIDATEDSGLGGTGWGGDIAVFDYDEDGRIDVFVGNMFGGSSLFRNQGNGRFEDVTAQALGRTPWGAVSARAFDFDGDGHLDLYVVDMHSDMWMPPDYNPSLIQEGKRYPGFMGRMIEDPAFPKERIEQLNRQMDVRAEKVLFGNALYRNLRNGSFEEVGIEARAETFWSWGIAAADFDNNGSIDVYLPSGMGFPFFYWRSPLLMNDGKGRFTDRSGDAGIDPPPGGTVGGTIGGKDAPRSGRSAAVFDVENDGRMDIIANNFNDRAFLFANRWPSANFIGFRLQGTRSNRDAVGAVVRVHAGDRVQVRQVQAAGGYLAQSTKTLHFGLDGSERVDRVEIRWPSGHVQEIAKPDTGRIHEVLEPGK